MQLSLKQQDGLMTLEGERFAEIYTYEVCGLPEGLGARIQNLDYPRTLWSIQRIRDGKYEGGPVGHFRTAQQALAALQAEFE
jgi:hypothetical protein